MKVWVSVMGKQRTFNMNLLPGKVCGYCDLKRCYPNRYNFINQLKLAVPPLDASEKSAK